MFLENDQFYLKDTISFTSKRYGYENPIPPETLYDPEQGNRFSFKLYINDQTYNPFDNPYGEFKYHMYTNMVD